MLIILSKAESNSNKTEHTKKREQVDTNITCPYEIHTKRLFGGKKNPFCITPNYQSNEMPSLENDTVKVFVNYTKYQILVIDQHRNLIHFNVEQDIAWCDPRMIVREDDGKEKFFPTRMMTEIWAPYPEDMPTYNLQEGRSLYYPNDYKKVEVFHENNETCINAWIEWRVSLFCKFNLSLFPFDMQTCQFHQEAIIENLELFLVNHEDYVKNYDDDVGATNYESGGFDITITLVGMFYNETSEHDTNQEIVGFDITIKRLVQRYFYEYYLPSFAIVIVSQISFIIPLSSVPGRVALLATNFLTLTNIFIYHMVSCLTT